MARNPSRRLLAPAAMCVVVVASLGYLLLDAQRATRAELEQRWTERARTTAGALDALLAATAQQSAATLELRYGEHVTDERLERHAAVAGLAYAAVASADGNLLAATRGAPYAAVTRAADAVDDPGSGIPGGYRLSGVHVVDGRPILEWIVPFRSDSGPRLQVAGMDVRRIAPFFGETLKHARAARALLLDRAGRVLGDSAGMRTAGRGLAPGAIAAAGGDDPEVASARIGRTPLRVLLVTRRSELLGPVAGADRWLPWLALALAALALSLGLLLTVRLVRSNLALRSSEERYALALQGAKDGLWDWDLTSGAVHLSDRWAELLELPADALGGDVSAWLDRVHPDDRPALDAALLANVTGRADVLDNEHRLQRADGSWMWVLARGAALFDAGGRAYRIAGSLTDVTARRTAVARLEHQANHDALTGLANRVHFFTLLERAVERATRADTPPCAVIFLDLDGFKAVNDRFGHLVGDRVLTAAAQRLEEHVRPGDVVGRLGGDELAVLVSRVHDVDEAEAMAARLTDALGRPYDIGGMTVQVGASAGVALAGRGEQAEELVQLADAAMYRAKLAA